jgi:hypothetical protein
MEARHLTSLEHFTVQPVAENGDADKGNCIHVDAQSPVQAAEIALGETLAIHGKPHAARAVVWKLGEDYSPICVKLYRAS